MIYVAEIQNRKWVKIGYSDESCINRVAQLQTGCPYKINLVLAVDGSLLQEQQIHKALRVALARIRLPASFSMNEWYQGGHPFIKKLISALGLGPNQALVYLDAYDPAVKQPGRDRPVSTLRQKTPAVVALLSPNGYPPVE